MWANAKPVPDREYQRVKIKASEIYSPCGSIVPNVYKTSIQSRKQPTARKSTPPRQLYAFSKDETDKDYEKLSDERCKKPRFHRADESENDTSDSELEEPTNLMKTPIERLFATMEKNISDLNQDIASKYDELKLLKDEIESARKRNKGILSVCGQCHLRDGHTKQNCLSGACLSV